MSDGGNHPMSQRPTPGPKLNQREPETIDEALADVHRRYCVPDAHDPVCQILHAAVGE